MKLPAGGERGNAATRRTACLAGAFFRTLDRLLIALSVAQSVAFKLIGGGG